MQRKPGTAPPGYLSRLKPIEHDPLAEYGLPSKGEKRLLSPKVQEAYYTKIVERYLAFCTEAGDREGLQKQFARLAIADRASSAAVSPLPQPASSPSKYQPLPSDDKLSQILSALRKLREALVASHRADDFATQVYLFSARLGILASSYETYYPSLLQLLRRHQRAQRQQRQQVHVPPPTTTSASTARHSSSSSSSQPNNRGSTSSSSGDLTSVEYHEVTSYLVIDAACRRADLAEAYALRHTYRLRDPKVDLILASLVADNWVAWRRVKKQVDGYRVRLMEFAEAQVRTHALKAFGRAYLSLPLGVLEAQMGVSWAELRERFGVGWELGDGEGGERRVVIRKVQGRS
ncbi:hypothetical protein C8A03DRAFT_40673 [Achaetomium macrosporum]|uniref:CSN8/PSMD8/EIF3K domain-containing protein n=1 Tax=Achaetomium macrosporum TaxID=79813 RepID=A0AAN7H9X3_9PEZI|nr:hypothetical protein C8A03DRAFT_40673 [Achaetomium macrosporum]